jgi:hypothetical protein
LKLLLQQSGDLKIQCRYKEDLFQDRRKVWRRNQCRRRRYRTWNRMGGRHRSWHCRCRFPLCPPLWALTICKPP